MSHFAPRSAEPSSLSELSLEAAQQWMEERGYPPFRGRQLFSALAVRGLQNVSDLTEFPVALRVLMGRRYPTRSLEVLVHARSALDRTEKVLFALNDGQTIETVLIPSRNPGRSPRETICVSSQAGCPAACSFCATGLAGFGRNLTATEIVDQAMFFIDRLRTANRRLTNIVFMGMGEPLLNVRSVREAVSRLTDPNRLGLGPRHITVSTVGIVPQVHRSADWAGQVNLAISLHAPNDSLRSELVPYNRHFPIASLVDAVESYIARTRRRVSFEYVLLKGTNDHPALAAELAELLRPFGSLAHVNLIPWNPIREGKFIRAEVPDADQFAQALRSRRVNATIRSSKGLDISAACGQLRDRNVKPVTPSDPNRLSMRSD